MASSVKHIVGATVLLVRVEHFLMEDLKELDVLVLFDAGAPGIGQLEEGVMELVFGERIWVLGRFIGLLFFRLRLSFLLVIVLGLLLAALAWLGVRLEVLTKHLGQFICVNSRSQDAAYLHERPDVFVLRAEFVGASLQDEVVADEVHDRGADARAVLKSITLGHVLVGVHAGIAVLVVGLRGEVIPAWLEHVLERLVPDLLGVLVVLGSSHHLRFKTI